ncbi:unnamed protein product [Allacma fusca]|uniref:Selenoprotein K n=1 Tax=Allacma fusca TaxID=39272 RepID=A0A8J2LQ46_9HEXA|nr:unnamed protein product [Allacma fusca]
MAYVTSDGRVQQSRPWSLSRVVDLFFGIYSFVILFFRSLFHLDDPSPRGQYGSRGRSQTVPRRGMGGVGRVSGVSPPPCFGGG